MTRYYFDLRDQDGLVADEEGIELRDLDAAEKEATQALADAARESFHRPVKAGQTAIEVRDHLGSVMNVRFTVEIQIARKN